MENSPGREMTYGEKAVGLTFNPSNDPRVQEIKALYAKIIDICNIVPVKENSEINGEQARLYKIAITEAQTAQMWAVKAVTYQF